MVYNSVDIRDGIRQDFLDGEIGFAATKRQLQSNTGHNYSFDITEWVRSPSDELEGQSEFGVITINEEVVELVEKGRGADLEHTRRVELLIAGFIEQGGHGDINALQSLLLETVLGTLMKSAKQGNLCDFRERSDIKMETYMDEGNVEKLQKDMYTSGVFLSLKYV